MKEYAFNGFLFSQRQTGVMRYAREILRELDKIICKDEYCLVVPEYADKVPELKNINIVRYGKTKGNLWEQLDFLRYLKKTGKAQFSFNNAFPMLCPGSVVIHDIAYRIHPEFGTSLHGKISNIYHQCIFFIASKMKYPIVTVSHFSKYQLIDEYHIDPKRITVIGSAWQHFDQIEEDNSILNRFGLTSHGFFFTLASLSIMKNTKFVIELAKKNPQSTFVLTGAKIKVANEKYEDLPNVIYTGYISDEKIKSLMRNCRAFIYPSIYDGFGLPPLEALSQKADVICSSAACLPEIYGNSVHYIDPYDTDVNLDHLLTEPVDVPESILRKYSWKKSAKALYELLNRDD